MHGREGKFDSVKFDDRKSQFLLVIGGLVRQKPSSSKIGIFS